MEMKCFRDVAGDFEEAGAQVLGVSIDPFPSQGAFAKELGVNFPLLSDWPRYETSKAYEVWRENIGIAMRGGYVIDKGGGMRRGIKGGADMAVHSPEAV